MPPTISTIVTVYNQARYLAKTIDSILQQTRTDFELVIWDDGSIDHSLAIARSYAEKDPRISVFAAEHRGQARAIQAAIEKTKGIYLGWVESDDILAFNALAEAAAILETHSEVGLVYTDYLIIDDLGRLHGRGKRCQIPYSPLRLLVDFMTFHFRLFRRSVYDRIEGIDTSLPYAFDYDLCLKFAEVTQIEHLQTPQYYHRLHRSSLSAQHRLEQIDCTKKAIEKALIRRGLDRRYDLEMEVISKFRLQPKGEEKSI
jgi:glycosyltransferase involved in cell wall biosynthesis